MVLQLDGAVADRRERSCAEVRADELGRGFAEGCRELPREKVPDAHDGVARYRQPIDPGGRVELD